ncbi:MAG TPA: hypothetical protein VMU37_09050 [Caulobacteraceae bacterium]|nr:hypothetical protein [Caulobacteraceae bacterium]
MRTGDKGDASQIAVIAYDRRDYDRLARELTADRLREHLACLSVDAMRRYELPRLGALNFVLDGALAGGVTRSLALDAHGKTLGAQLHDLEIDDEL